MIAKWICQVQLHCSHSSHAVHAKDSKLDTKLYSRRGCSSTHDIYIGEDVYNIRLVEEILPLAPAKHTGRNAPSPRWLLSPHHPEYQLSTNLAELPMGSQCKNEAMETPCQSLLPLREIRLAKSSTRRDDLRVRGTRETPRDAGTKDGTAASKNVELGSVD